MILFRLLRLRQWAKSAFVVAPIIFSRQFESVDAWETVIAAAFAFALVASAIYIFNDMMDRKEDAMHPVKSSRPLAAGDISMMMAACILLGCLFGAFLLLAFLPAACHWVLGIYILVNLLYSILLKHHALLDVFVVASCFIMRVLMGCFALAVMVSPWILLTTFMLALFLSFAKRYHELGFSDYVVMKKNLQGYSREFLDRLVMISAACTLVSYAIYTAEVSTIPGRENMVYTLPFVAFGLFRYLQSIYIFGKGGEPENVILQDVWQWINIGLWLATTLWVLS